MKHFLFIVSIVCVFLACDDKKESTQEQEEQKLNQMLTEIQALASSKSCDDSSEWAYTSYGSKACGGPIGYIAYSTSIDTELFLKKVEDYTIAQNQYNRKWNIASDCAYAIEPTGVVCENGKPVFAYKID